MARKRVLQFQRWQPLLASLLLTVLAQRHRLSPAPWGATPKNEFAARPGWRPNPAVQPWLQDGSAQGAMLNLNGY